MEGGQETETHEERKQAETIGVFEAALG